MPSGECSIEPWVFMNWRRAAYYLYLAEVIDAKNVARSRPETRRTISPTRCPNVPA